MKINLNDFFCNNFLYRFVTFNFDLDLMKNHILNCSDCKLKIIKNQKEISNLIGGLKLPLFIDTSIKLYLSNFIQQLRKDL